VDPPAGAIGIIVIFKRQGGIRGNKVEGLRGEGAADKGQLQSDLRTVPVTAPPNAREGPIVTGRNEPCD
jgi:hypothetical protein